MHLESYNLIYDSAIANFSFTSVGKKGKFKKIITFQRFGNLNIYNLAFGDENARTKEIDDLIVTDNGDTEKVLATVAKALYLFTYESPQSWVFIKGSTPSRTKLYQIGINKFLDFLEEDFDIFGQLESDWMDYDKKVRYKAFLTRRKKYF